MNFNLDNAYSTNSVNSPNIIQIGENNLPDGDLDLDLSLSEVKL